MIDPAATEKLSPSDSRQAEELHGDGVDDDSVQRLGTGSNMMREEIREYVTLGDVWLPKEGLLVTMADQSGGPALRIVPWEGPEHGPYILLGFDVVPGNVMQLYIDKPRKRPGSRRTNLPSAVCDGDFWRVV